MTRETKIGLLVGLAFIIVIGVLLSDHMTATNEPTPAMLAQAGGSVRDAISVPGLSNPQPVVRIDTPEVVPARPVPTREDLHPQARPAPEIRIGPGTPREPAPAAPLTTTTPPPADAAEFEPVRGVDPVAAVLEYRAQSGDTVSRLAGRFLGSNTADNRRKIIDANPSLKANPDRIIVGQTYLIPRAETIRDSAARDPTPAVAASPEAPAAADAVVYTVKAGDSLWKIASRQVGDPGAIAAIKELNRDVLEGDRVVPGMKLRLPGRSGR